MDIKIVEEKVIEKMSAPLKVYGYKYINSKSYFVRREEGREIRVVPIFTKWSSSSSVLLSAFLHVRFDQIEEVLNKYRSYVTTKKMADSSVTIVKNILETPQCDVIVDRLNVDDECDVNPAVEYMLDLLDTCLAINHNYVSNVNILDFPSFVDLEEDSPSLECGCENLLAMAMIRNNVEDFDKLVSECREKIIFYKKDYYLPDFEKIVDGLRGELR